MKTERNEQLNAKENKMNDFTNNLQCDENGSFDFASYHYLMEGSMTVGTQILVNGSWAIVDEVLGNGTFIVSDEDGDTFEVTSNDIDHVY
jgi:hypothetical protein